MGHCTYGSLQHLQTSEHCPYRYIALQLQSQDGQSATQLATLQWLSQLFRQQLPAPKTWCVPCRNAHTQGGSVHLELCLTHLSTIMTIQLIQLGISFTIRIMITSRDTA